MNNYRKDEYQTFITVTNTGDEAIKNWSLKFDCPYKIDSVYNGVWKNYNDGYAKCEDGSYLITNQGCNANIDVGQSIKVSYIFKTQDEVVDPTYLYLDHEIDYSLDSDSDRLPDCLEKEYGTNPHNRDTDSDGLDDYIEFRLSLDPLKKIVMEME